MAGRKSDTPLNGCASEIDQHAWERKLGDTEASYYLPSRLPSQDPCLSGVNDMYLHIGFDAPPELVTPSRLQSIWSILRLENPLLASCVVMHDYDDISFRYSPPRSSAEVLRSASESSEFRKQDKDALIDSYLNGPRTLSDSRLSYIIVAEAPENDATSNARTYHLLLATTHFIGDGMSLHKTANEFFLKLIRSTDDLAAEIEQKIRGEKSCRLPSCLEDRLTGEEAPFRRIACDIAYQARQRKDFGGHSIPRSTTGKRQTIVKTISFSNSTTQEILRKCKINKVSIAAAMFAVCNVAWGWTASGKRDLPTMMYSALNLRPSLKTTPTESPSWWFIAIGYFNVVLPSFIPKDNLVLEQIFWERARSAKSQIVRAAKHPLLLPFAKRAAQERGSRARGWAKEDDARERGETKPQSFGAATQATASSPPSIALTGLSLLGDLDSIYSHSEYGPIKLHTLTTGSRQRAGASLLFSYTFCGKLWVSLGYDQTGLERSTMEKFWENCGRCMNEMFNLET